MKRGRAKRRRTEGKEDGREEKRRKGREENLVKFHVVPIVHSYRDVTLSDLVIPHCW